MTLTVEDDFREFVAARWPDLEGVAYVVTLDPASARRVTTDALAALHQRWRSALDEGRPGATARREVLVAAVSAAGRRTGSPSPATVPAATNPAPDPASGSAADPRADDDADDRVLVALEVAVRAASPLERAVVAAGSLWDAGPDEVADLLGMPYAQVRERAATLRARLVAAHDGARAADGLEPADWALDADLDAVVARLLAGQGDPPDPTALVEQRRNRVRRRSVLVGAGAAALVGGSAWWLVGRDGTSAAGPTAPTRPTVGPDDPVWASLASWPPRGRLATDPRIQALVISRSTDAGRLVWADDVHGQRLVISTTSNPGTTDVIVQAWHGPAGADPATLEDVPFTGPYATGETGTLTVAVPGSPGTLLLVLARPTETEAEYSATVQPAPDGSIDRAWRTVTLDQGVGVEQWADPPGPALRVRLPELDGPPVSTAELWVEQATDDAALTDVVEGTRRFVAAATGAPLEAVATEVVLDAKVAGELVPDTATQGRDARVLVLRTTTADGALVRSVRVADGSSPWWDIESPTVLPAGAPRDEPVVARLADERSRVGRFLVVAPGAARVQLLSTSPNAYPASKVTRTRRGIAIVEVVNADQAAAFRLVRRDAAGRRLGDGVPATGRDLLNLWSGEEVTVLTL